VSIPLTWLTARPIAHRGLHDAARGLIENTAGAVTAAIEAGFGIEVDLQVSGDGEAMVYHDDTLGRLAEGTERLDRLAASALKQLPFRGSSERMMTLSDLCDLVAGRAAIAIELKSRFDGDDRLPSRVAEVLTRYGGSAAPMSFDPRQIQVLRHKAPHIPCGIVAAKYRPHPYWDLMPVWMRRGMGYLLTGLAARPQFVAYAVADLPAFAPLFARRVLGLPLLAWTVRTESERQRAMHWADQMIFEGLRP
jgi:glycerophosphoryl diester phosphodiesterase